MEWDRSPQRIELHRLPTAKDVQTNQLYEHLLQSLGDIELTRIKAGAVTALEEAEQQGKVPRERTVPEGGVLLEHTDYRQSPHALPWPERYLESLPCLADPYLRAAYLSTQTASWDHFPVDIWTS